MTRLSIEQLPQTASGKRLLGFVSPIYDNSLWLKSYFDALGVTFDWLTDYFSTFHLQHFTETVDWAIELQERKYSLEPAPQLSLEQRRERLRRKAAVHLPLNPAVLEKYARETYDFECFLDESKAGHIRIVTNKFTNEAPDFVKWLLDEKPAHLILGGEYVRAFYIGEEKFVVPDDEPRIYFEPAIPKNDADKIHFPRLFAQTVETHVGLKELSIPHPHNIKGTVYAIGSVAEFGDKNFSLAEPFIFRNNRHQLYAAQALTKGGQLFVEADLRDLPSYDNLIENPLVELALADIALARDGRIKIPTEIYERFQRINLFAGTAHRSTGTKIYSLHRPENQKLVSQVGQILIENGLKSISTSTVRKFGHIGRANCGQVLTRTGTIKFDSETKSTLAENELFFVERSDNHVAQTLLKQGTVDVSKTGGSIKKSRLVTIKVGQGLIRAGEIHIGF